jgi:uncharacterized protein YkwD
MSVRTRATLALCVLLAAALAGTSAGARPQTVGVTAVDDLERAVLAEINTVRRQNGLTALRINPRLRAAADAHSTSMARRGFFAHESADGSSFWKRVARYYPRQGRASWSVGENLLWSSPGADAAGSVRMWMNSPSHRKNLLAAQWREIGLSAVHVDAGPGVFNGARVTILTADFGRRR